MPEGEEADADCPGGKALESGTHTAVKCVLYKEERDVRKGKCERKTEVA